LLQLKNDTEMRELLDLRSHHRTEGGLTWEEIFVRLFQVNVTLEVPLRLSVIGELKNLLDTTNGIIQLLFGDPPHVVRRQFENECRLLGVYMSASDSLLGWETAPLVEVRHH